MTTSQLITRLTELQAKYGDLEVGISGASPDEGWIYGTCDCFEVLPINDHKQCISILMDDVPLDDDAQEGEED